MDAGPSGDAARSAWLTGPGLELAITGAAIDPAGVATVSFTITDGAGVPLDLDGRYTEGAVTVRFVLAALAPDGPYTAYTTREVVSPITGDTATQASADADGVFAEVGVAQGTYVYTFAASAAGADPTLTHTVAAWATREAFGERWVANATFDFRPDGQPPTAFRDIVSGAGCNGCHGRLEAHGGVRRDVRLCVTCHSPQSSDPDTGNTVDFAVMIHKIHRGEDLPSVLAGTPYQIIGFNQSVNDYSTVAFPRDIRACDACHDGADGDRWHDRPSRAACGSCHDLTTFEPGGTHAGGPQPTDGTCVTCHPAAGTEFAVIDTHDTPFLDPPAHEVALAILGVTNAGPGQQPTITFQVTVDGAPRDLQAAPLTSLRATVAGPTTDYSRVWQGTIQGGGASGTLAAVDAAAGIFAYTFAPAGAMPPDAAGTYAFGLEGTLLFGADRFAAMNPIAYVAVTDATPAPRRAIVEQARCDACHGALSAHGGSRRAVAYCAMCHNPENTNDERVARFEGTTVVAQSVDLKVMIHAIHRGEDHEAPYVLGGFPVPSVANPAGTPVDFGEVRFPNDLRECQTCHLPGTWDLPLGASVLPSRVETLVCEEDPLADADSYCQTRASTSAWIRPTTAVCTACHDAEATRAHAEIMTTAMGVESCATCHDAGSAVDIGLFHRRDP